MVRGALERCTLGYGMPDSVVQQIPDEAILLCDVDRSFDLVTIGIREIDVNGVAVEPCLDLCEPGW